MVTIPCLPTAPLVRRHIAIGQDSSLAVDMGLVPLPEGTGVVLRDARPRNAGALGLTGAFEYVATVLRHELVYLKNLPDNLRFFHARYEMCPTGMPRWVAQEVLLRGTEQHAGASWVAPDEAAARAVTAALNSWGAPQRKPL